VRPAFDKVFHDAYYSPDRRKETTTMNGRRLLTFSLLATALVLGGCTKKNGGGADSALLGQNNGTVAGIKWGVPSRWLAQGERPMRAATYGVPAAEGDSEGGECAVFYFGNDQGGTIDANIDRWVGQFEQASAPVRGTKDVNGMKVTTVEIAGSYLAPSGPMMMPSGKKDNFKLLGAIIQGPEGSVFFKFTGPAKTIDASAAEFDAMIGSIRKQ
jgi:hypothetical protein